GLRGEGRRRLARRGGRRPGRPHPDRLARPAGTRDLDAVDARRDHVAGSRRAAGPVLTHMIEPADIAAARKRLEGAIYETPCPYSQTLSELSGVRCFVKLENLQMTGSFKERAAANL